MPSKNDFVLVIGGGIAGIQASLDLENAGLSVHLIDKATTLGGRIARLYRVFPTLDNVEDLLTQKASIVLNSPNINILTNSEIKKIEGEAGNFEVEITEKPTYVDETKCTNCGECESVCPVSVPKDFEMGLGYRKAIHQSSFLPKLKRYVIDDVNCFHFGNKECQACVDACPMEAIDLDQKSEIKNLQAGSIIVATGSNLFDAEKKPEYGYGLYTNTITGLEYEQLSNPNGPTEGKIVRISDKTKPKAVSFILCIGFRDEKSNRYCCRTGCMSALKHAYVLKEQYGDEVDAYIFYTDLRAAGIGYEEFYRKARESGIILIKGKPSEVRSLPDSTLNVEVFESSTHKLLSIASDLVVLEGGATPNNKLKDNTSIQLREDGFYACIHPVLSSTETEVKGIFLAGTAQGPKDIPETITHASAAAMKAIIMRRNNSK